MKARNQLRIGSLLSYTQMALSILIGLAYTPVMIRLLGKSEYGLYNTVSSTIAALGILNLGFNSGYIRFYSKYKKAGDHEAISSLNGLFLLIFLFIGFIGLCCGLFLVNHLELVFKEGLTEQEYAIARVLMLLLTVNLAVAFPMSVFQNIISAHERFIFLKSVSILKTVLSPLVTLPLLLAGFRSIAMVAVALAIAVFTDLIYLYYVLVKLKNRFVFHGFEKGIIAGLFAYSGFIALNTIVDQINWNIDKILLGRFIGTEAVAVYSVGYSLYAYYMTFSTSISSVFTPRIHSMVLATADDPPEQRRRLTELFVKVGRIQFLLLGLIASGMIFFGMPFITVYWAGAGYSESYHVALLLTLPATIALTQNVGIEIQRAENKHWFRSIAYFVMALINLVLSIYLCQRYGAIGSALGTALSLVFGNGLIMNIYYHRQCNIDVLAFWQNILRMVKGLVIPAALGILIDRFCNLRRPLIMILCIVGYSAVYAASVWFLSMNSYEKSIVTDLILRKLKRRGKQQ